MIKLAIIDFDDTLCMTEEACFHLENDAASKLGFPPMGRDVHKKSWGQPVEIAILERIPGIDPEKFMSKLTALMPKLIQEGKLDVITSQNLSALDALKKNGMHLALLTTRTFNEVKHLINRSHPLSTRIEAFYYKENSVFRKPDPRVFTEILEKFNIKPREAVYVGDNVSDAECAKSAGLFFIASLESGLKTKKDFGKIDYFIDKFSDLPKALDFLNK